MWIVMMLRAAGTPAPPPDSLGSLRAFLWGGVVGEVGVMEERSEWNCCLLKSVHSVNTN